MTSIPAPRKPAKCVIFHCSNFPKDFYGEPTVMDAHEMLQISSGRENIWGTLQGRIKTGPMTFLRLNTDDVIGKLTAYVGVGESLADPAPTWGGIGVVRIPNLQNLLRYICEKNFEHHVSVSLSAVGPGQVEALQHYLGWNVYAHEIGAGKSKRQGGVSEVRGISSKEQPQIFRLRLAKKLVKLRSK